MNLPTHEFKKKYPRLYQKIIEIYGGRKNVFDVYIAIDLYLKGISPPKCRVCGNHVTITKRFKNGIPEKIYCKYHMRKSKVFSHNDMRKEAQSRGLDINIEKLPEYPTMATHVTFICPTHGEYKQHWSYFKNKNGKCQKCYLENDVGKQIRIPFNHWEEKSKKAHDGKYQYLKDTYVDCASPVGIICPVHGQFTQNAGVHSRGHGCPRCAGSANGDRLRCSQEDFVQKCNKKHNYKYDYSKTVYEGMGRTRKKVTITCPIHGDFKQNPNDHLIGGHGCQACGLEVSTSKSRAEYDLVEYIESLGEKQVVHGWYGHFFEVDILVNSRFGIEYDGIYYHSTTDIEPGRLATKHEMKTRVCEKNGKFLVHIFENEWKCPDRQETWKSIIRRELGKSINIANCEITDTDEAPEDFYRKNSLFSPTSGKFLIFSKYRKTYASVNYEVSGDEFVVHNISQVHDCEVMSLFGQIEEFALSKKCSRIRTAIDRRYENPNLFYENGYQKVETVAPKFYYVWKYELTPHDNHDIEEMLSKGYSRIWDCGEYILSKEIK